MSSSKSMNSTQSSSNLKCSKCHDQPGVYFTSSEFINSMYPYLCTTCIKKISIEARNVLYKKIM